MTKTGNRKHTTHNLKIPIFTHVFLVVSHLKKARGNKKLTTENKQLTTRKYPYLPMSTYAGFPFFSVITVISGQMPKRPEKAKKPKPRLTYR